MVKAIVGSEFTYEQFRKMAEAKTYPDFYVQFEKRMQPERNVIMTRKQARSLIAREEEDKIEVTKYDDKDIDDLFWEDPEDKQPDKRVTFALDEDGQV